MTKQMKMQMMMQQDSSRGADLSALKPESRCKPLKPESRVQALEALKQGAALQGADLEALKALAHIYIYTRYRLVIKSQKY